MAEQVPAGWYPDAGQAGHARWWDGNQWTEHRSATSELQQSEPAPNSDEVIAAAPPSSWGSAPSATKPAAPAESGHLSAEPVNTQASNVATFAPTQVVGNLIELDARGVLLFRKLATSKPHLELPMSTVSGVRVNDMNNVIDFDRVGQPPLDKISATSKTAFVRTSTTSREEWLRVREALVMAERLAVDKTPAPPAALSEPRKRRKVKKRKPGQAEGWLGAIVGGSMSAGIGAFTGGLTYALIAGTLGAIGFGIYSYTKTKKEAGARGVDGIHTLGGVTFSGTRITYAGASQPVAGTHVEVLTSGQISRRFDWGNTITGAALLGPVGAVIGAREKKADDRELYLVITGAERVWSVKLSPKDSELARSFAAAVNTAALKAAK